MNQPQYVLDELVRLAKEGHAFLKSTTVAGRAAFMHAVADQIESLDETLLETAHRETALPLARLKGEKARTVGQWRSYADAVAQGIYADIRLDTANPEKGKNDLRKYSIGLGPVVVFGASNFPFAFSTAGGDTASAIGAGCSVIVKAHPAHPDTSRLMADAITAAVTQVGWPAGVFGHVAGEEVEGTDTKVGAYLTAHPDIKAVGFTGSQAGGKALAAIAAQREEPIPVFAEMGSINPVFALPQALASRPEELAREYAASLVLGVGQFCTNPGLFVAARGSDLERFKEALKIAIQEAKPASMLHSGIFAHYEKGRQAASRQTGVTVLATSDTPAEEGQGTPAVVLVSGATFLDNQALAEEVFGPFAILVEADGEEEMLAIANRLQGQLTATLAATPADLANAATLVRLLQDKAGRLLFNGMPTGVEVVFAMQHGGPYPATTDPRFTSVGPDAVKRFVRPVAYQNWPHDLLPAELQNDNPLGVLRIVDGICTSDALPADASAVVA